MHFTYENIKAVIKHQYEKIIADNCPAKTEIQFIFETTLKIVVVYFICILSIVRSNFLYLDDIGRNFHGVVSDWSYMSRFLSEAVCKILSTNPLVSDISPFSQIFTLLLMALSVCILAIRVLPSELSSKKTKWLYVAVIPFAINPYFLENLSYKIECVVHGVSIFFAVLPFAFKFRNNVFYTIVAALSTICVCVTYQAALCVFPVVTVFLAMTSLSLGQDKKSVTKEFLYSVAAFFIGLIIFKLFIMRPLSGFISNEIFSLKEIIPGAVHNLRTYYTTILNDFDKKWIAIIVVLTGAFSISFVKKFEKKFYGCMVLMVGLFCILMLNFGIYPVLQKPTFQPRVMYGIAIELTLFAIFLVKNNSGILKLPALLLAISFASFSFTYGNCLAAQNDYTEMRMGSVINWLNLNADPNCKYLMQIKGDIGIAPSIETKLHSNRILKRLIPSTFGEGMYGEYRFYKYYNLSPNFTPIWQWEQNEETDLTRKNLPEIIRTSFFEIFADEANILIVLK